MSPSKRTPFKDVLASLRRLAGKGTSPNGKEDGLEVPSVAGSTGQTLFGAMPVRLRNLTGEPVDTSIPDPGQLPGAFKIRLARSRSSSQHAGHLIERRYAWRGYHTPGFVPEATLRTFVAYHDNALVGTVSVRLDSPKALSADGLYKDELDKLRAAGGRLCEFTRLAVDDEAISKAVLGGLFHTAYMYAHLVHGCDHGVIEVNPRHAVFYRRSLFFEMIGPERINPRVNAPSVLLCVSFEKIHRELAKYFASADKPASRLMFSHWFPPEEAVGVLNRLRQLHSQPAAYEDELSHASPTAA